MDRLLAKITDFWERRGLFKNPDLNGQLYKIDEEINEMIEADLNFSRASSDDNRIELLREIGDVATALNNFAVMFNTSLETCLKLSHIKNEKRKGKFVNGEWVHE